MQSNFISLESLEIARPCRADWNAMTGDAQVRLCQSCKKNVYNFSEMTRDEAMRLLLHNEGHLCVRLHRRADGTVITSDCPVGEMRPKRAPWMRVMVAAFGFVAGLVGLHGAFAANSNDVVVTAGEPVMMPTPTPTPAHGKAHGNASRTRTHSRAKRKVGKIQHR